MLNVTLNVALEMMKSLDGEAEIVICDNSDEDHYEIMSIAYPHGWLKKGLVRVFRQDEPGFTTARMTAAREAKGEYILCVDSHVLFGYRTLVDSLNFMDSQKDNEKLGFGHPPIRWAHQGPAAVKHTLKVSDYGAPNGGWDCAYSETRPMYWKFMPWICRRDWFLDVLNGYGTHAKHNVSWGGAEELMQVKSLMLGYENWAIATDPVAHIGPYTPAVVKTGQYKYRTYAANGNYPHGFGVILARYILAGEEFGYELMEKSEEQFKNRHKFNWKEYWQRAIHIGKEEHEWLYANCKYTYRELIEKEPWKEQTQK